MVEPEYTVTVRTASPRPIAAVRARLSMRNVPAQFAKYLDQVYAASRAGTIEVDGQNIFVYRRDENGEADVDFGVGAVKPFAPTGAVFYGTTPAGEAATTTHWGDYALLGRAHEAVIRWCRERGHVLAGPRWEVYGHWADDPAARRTDIFHLLEGARSTNG